jgi:hypothetical protein
MEFKRELPVMVRFTVADRITVRQQMAYLSDATASNRPHIERLWLGAAALIQEWDCELFSKDVDLDEVTDARITEIMVWAALQVRNHVNSLDEIPKN